MYDETRRDATPVAHFYIPKDPTSSIHRLTYSRLRLFKKKIKKRGYQVMGVFKFSEPEDRMLRRGGYTYFIEASISDRPNS